MADRSAPAWSQLVGLVGDELRERFVALALEAAGRDAVALSARFDRREGGFRGVVVSARAGEQAQVLGPASPADVARLEELVAERTPWHGPGFDEPERGRWELAGDRWFLAVPIRSRGARPYPLGSVCVVSGHEPDRSTRERLDELALAVAVAMEVGDREHDAVARVRDMEATVRNLRASAQVARAVAAESDIASLLDLIVEQGLSLARARGMAVLLEREGTLDVVAEAGELTAGEREGSAPASFSVPMVFRGEQLGLLAAFAGRLDAPAGGAVPASGHPLVDGAPRALEAEAEQLLRAFAGSAATAVATARSVAESRLRSTVRAAELERRSWARELHDETLQGLAGVRLLLESTAGAPTEAEREETLHRAAARLAEEIARLRALITDLRPAVLDQLGLGAALRALRDRMATDHGLVPALAVDVDGAAPLGQEVETVAYRIVQESLTNVARHASARRVAVAVRVAGDGLEVSVADDGVGFDPDAVDEARSFGVLGMRERAQLVGGVLRIGPGEHGGAEVHVRIPLARPGAGQTSSSLRSIA